MIQAADKKTSGKTPGDAEMKVTHDIERIAARIATLGRREITRHLLQFNAGFPMDFTPDYLARLPLDRLRHLLLAAYLHRARRRAVVV
jgi:hypothetical protein